MKKIILSTLLLLCLAGCGQKEELVVEPIPDVMVPEVSETKPQENEIEPIPDVIAPEINETKPPQNVVEPVPDLTTEPSEKPAEDYVDLTVLSSTMVFAEVYNIMSKPQDYIGKTIKMTGRFWSFYEELSGVTYLGCLIMDATACCQQGIEFILAEDMTYPQEGASITVEGRFETYEESGMTYCHLVDATMEILAK